MGGGGAWAFGGVGQMGWESMGVEEHGGGTTWGWGNKGWGSMRVGQQGGETVWGGVAWGAVWKVLTLSNVTLYV